MQVGEWDRRVDTLFFLGGRHDARRLCWGEGGGEEEEGEGEQKLTRPARHLLSKGTMHRVRGRSCSLAVFMASFCHLNALKAANHYVRSMKRPCHDP